MIKMECMFVCVGAWFVSDSWNFLTLSVENIEPPNLMLILPGV